MAFVQSIGKDGVPLEDNDGQPILIPTPMVEGSTDRSNVTVTNEVSAWEKMNTEQKLQYQE